MIYHGESDIDGQGASNGCSAILDGRGRGWIPSPTRPYPRALCAWQIPSASISEVVVDDAARHALGHETGQTKANNDSQQLNSEHFCSSLVE